METLMEALRDILGNPTFYRRMTDSTNYTWDYGAMLEYMIAGVILCVVIASVFKFIRVLIR